MAIIYVSASGSDSNDGSIGTPKLTPRAAQIAANSNGKVLLKAGECFDPSSGGLFFYINVTSGIEIGTYGTASDKPILDALTYQNPGVAGWTYVNSGIWKKTFGAFYIRRLWVGSTSLGNLVSQRVIGTAKRRATGTGMTGTSANPSESIILAALSPHDIWFGAGSTLSYALYVYTGSGTIDPPTYYGGLAFIQSDGSTVGAVEGLMILGRSGIYCHDVHFRGNGSVGIRLNTKNSMSSDCYDNLITDCTVTHCYNGAFISRIDAETTPLYRCKSSTIRRVYCDYSSSADEMEPDTTYNFLSGACDLFNVADGSVGVTIEECTAINSAHMGIVTGSSSMATTPPAGCQVINNTVRYDSWHTYARGLGCYDADTIFTGNLIDGQTTRSQFAGSAKVIGNVWINMRPSVRKINVSQWIACESYIFDSGITSIGAERYIKINPTAVLISNNTAFMPAGISDAAIGMHFYSNGLGSNNNTFASGAVTVQNNIVYGLPANFVQTYEDAGRTISNQVVSTNCAHNGVTGDNKVLWRGTSYAINAAPGCGSNVEINPLLDTTHKTTAASLQTSGVFVNGSDYYSCPFGSTPPLGAVMIQASKSIRSPSIGSPTVYSPKVAPRRGVSA